MPDVAVIGLGTMGQNLALNLLEQQFCVRAYDVSPQRGQALLHTSQQEGSDSYLSLPSDLSELVNQLKSPRKILLLVPAGSPVDSVSEQLLAAGLSQDDIVVDLGNSLWRDSVAREKRYRNKFCFFGTGISGGEVGARSGASLMASGDAQAWQALQPVFNALAAKVGGQPCVVYTGPAGSGHFVKMVHNGIEYADMQLLCEAYHLLRAKLGLTPALISQVFEHWRHGPLASYLVDITADILQQVDPVTYRPLVDVILDKAGQKGTGRWTAITALDSGVPLPTVAAAVFERAMSAQRSLRQHAAQTLAGPTVERLPESEHESFIQALHDALYCGKVCAYAQGFSLISAAAREHRWPIDCAAVARAWRGGCIIRAAILEPIADALSHNVENLLMAPAFAEQLANCQQSWRRIVGISALDGIPTPALTSALSYVDSLRSVVLPANLLQAQRDYFGAHSYSRVDQPESNTYHLDWSSPGREQFQVNSKKKTST